MAKQNSLLKMVENKIIIGMINPTGVRLVGFLVVIAVKQALSIRAARHLLLDRERIYLNYL